MSLTPALRARIESLLAANTIVLFMKGEPRAPQCGFSAKVAGTLKSMGVDYTHVDVLSDPEIREGIKAYSDWPTIPQLYIGGELVGGCDIVQQMASSGELHSALGLPMPDRSPPRIQITPAAAQMLREAVTNAGDGYALQVDVDERFNAKLQLAPIEAQAIAAELEGLRVQFDLTSARRAEGLSIDWVDDERGRGLTITHPNAPAKVADLTPAEAAERVRGGEITLIDVRPADERAIASVNVPHSVFDGDGRQQLEALPKGTPIAFLCHHGGRSAQAAEAFRALGFQRVFNIVGGIDAWSSSVDTSIAQY